MLACVLSLFVLAIRFILLPNIMLHFQNICKHLRTFRMAMLTCVSSLFSRACGEPSKIYARHSLLEVASPMIRLRSSTKSSFKCIEHHSESELTQAQTRTRSQKRQVLKRRAARASTGIGSPTPKSMPRPALTPGLYLAQEATFPSSVACPPAPRRRSTSGCAAHR